MLLILDYFLIFLFFFVSFILGFILIFLNKMFAKINYDNEKLSSYECGFDPFDSARLKFNIQYYLIAILFIIFDLEIVYLFP